MFVTHQSHNIPGVMATEGLAAAEGNGDHNEDDEGAEICPQVFLHGVFDRAREGEHTHHAEGEQQLKGQDAEDLQGDGNSTRASLLTYCTVKPRGDTLKQTQSVGSW